MKKITLLVTLFLTTNNFAQAQVRALLAPLMKGANVARSDVESVEVFTVIETPFKVISVLKSRNVGIGAQELLYLEHYAVVDVESFPRLMVGGEVFSKARMELLLVPAVVEPNATGYSSLKSFQYDSSQPLIKIIAEAKSSEIEKLETYNDLILTSLTADDPKLGKLKVDTLDMISAGI